MNIDYVSLESAFLDTSFERFYWLDRKTGKVLSADDWSKGEARKLDSPNDAEHPNVRLAWCLLWENGEVGSEYPGEEEKERVRAIMDPLISIPWDSTCDEDNVRRRVDAWLESEGLLEEAAGD